MKRVLVIIVTALAVVVAACGDSGDGSDTSGASARTVEVEMVDIAFEPKILQVKQGETIRFVFRNSGKVAHDAFVGDAAAQKQHEEEMREGADGHGGHGGSDEAVTVDPGGREELTHTFDEPGTVEIGCHQPGHYPAGMKITVEVA